MSDSINFFYSRFHIQYSKAGNCYLFGVNNNQTLISQILTVISSLEEMFNCSIPCGFEPKSAFSHKTCKIKSHSELQNST